ncbi:MAG: CLC_0170 family protein [Tissierellales bacterium]
MTLREVLVYNIKPLLTGYLIFYFILTGLFVLVIDRRELKRAGKKKDAKLAKGIGMAYIIVGPILYIIGRII